ncbi:sulfotransferase, partial [Arthrospira platensis SPKY1]|nr:sulfotransferase [Arthrospira platensis SPKY1]
MAARLQARTLDPARPRCGILPSPGDERGVFFRLCRGLDPPSPVNRPQPSSTHHSPTFPGPPRADDHMTTAADQDRPIFIVGAPRSGTTLLQYMLRSHPEISLPTGESHFLVPLYRDQNAYGDLSRVENITRVLEAMEAQSASFLHTDLHGLR